MRPVITIDIDNVVFFHYGGICKIVSDLHGVLTRFMESAAYILPRPLVCAAFAKYSEDAHLLDQSLPFQIMRAEADYDLRYLSSRPAYASQSSIRMFAANGIPIRDGQLVFARGDRKPAVAAALGSVLHIDDSDWIVKKFLGAKLAVGMISNDWTRYNHYLRPVVNWAENLGPILANRERFL